MRGRRQLLLAAGLTAALAAGCGPQAASGSSVDGGEQSVLFTTDYQHADAVKDAWGHVQVPSVDGQPQRDRITITRSPTSDDRVLRVELRRGDVQESGGLKTNRAEVYDRHAEPGSSTPPAEWPDPVGSVRWYNFAVFIPTDFATADDDKWLDLTQWKGYRGGSPPLALEIKRSQLRLGGTEGSDSLGRIDKGEWTRLTFGVHWSPDQDGWVEVWRDGKRVVERTAGPTMDTVDGEPDPIYLKQGIYRSKAWDDTHVVYFGPLTIATAREDVMPGSG